MNKRSLQAFSAGIIFATAILAGFYYGNNINEKQTVTAIEAKKLLVAQGYSVTKKTIQSTAQLDQSQGVKEKTTKNTQVLEDNKDSKTQKKVISHILKIKSKMTTSEIAKLLEEEKIIDNADEFQQYMNKKDLSRKVQIGEYIVSSNMSYKDIGKLITK